VFLDANVQIYHFLQVEPLAQTCRMLFRRIAKREIEAFTSADVAAAEFVEKYKPNVLHADESCDTMVLAL